MLELEKALAMSLADFRRQIWRRKPLLVKGGAKHLSPLKRDQFYNLRNQSLQRQPHNVQEGPGVSFLQNIDCVSESHLRLSQAIGQALECSRVHFDAVSADDGQGIGCHFDASDNFVLQQTGAKVWKLHNPSVIPESELQERLSGGRNGNIHMITPEHEFFLEAGDLLYMPLFWIHWGTSVGDSLSQSIVIQPDHLRATPHSIVKGREWTSLRVDWKNVVARTRQSDTFRQSHLRRFLQIAREFHKGLDRDPGQTRWLELLERTFQDPEKSDSILGNRKLFKLHEETAQAIALASRTLFDELLERYSELMLSQLKTETARDAR